MMAEISGISVAMAFLAGTASFLSPCVLPLVPGYLSYVTGQTAIRSQSTPGRRSKLAALRLSGSFVLGFSMIFIALGASATALGQMLQSYRGTADLVAGAIVTVFGLHLMGVLKILVLNREIRPVISSPGDTAFAPFILGAAFAFGWTPCIGPILGSVLTISAINMSVGNGIALLSIYSLGLGLPFLLVAVFASQLSHLIRKSGRISRVVQILSGLTLTAIGIAMMTGYLSSIGTWLLLNFPIFQTLLF